MCFVSNVVLSVIFVLCYIVSRYLFAQNREAGEHGKVLYIVYVLYV